MTLKRKSTAPISTSRKTKATKVKEVSDKSAKSDEEDFAGFENDEPESDDLDALGEAEVSEDEGDIDVDNEEAMAIDTPKSITSKPTNGKEKDTPAHAAQRALAKERKLSRPNGITFPDNDL
jgi:hypothetical protein